MAPQGNTPIRVGIAGLGRSGWNIHAKTIEALPDHFTVAAVSDPDANRRAEAEQRFGCKHYDEFEALIADDDLELIVVASPNRLHAEHTMAALQAGKHVLCEKPFAMSAEEADRVIAVSNETGKLVAPFQNRRFEPPFQKVKQVIDSGLLGRIVMIRMTAHGFKRRWDWQTLKKFGGGTLNNTGPHFLDQALELFGDGEPNVFCQMDCALTLGDAEDHVKVVLHGEGHPTVEVEMSDACPFGQDRFLVMGTRGGLRGTGELEWKWIDPSELPEREVDTDPTPDRSYNKEELTWHSDSWQPDNANATPMAQQLYGNVFDAVRKGEPLIVTPEQVRRQIAVIEQCHETAPV